MPTHSPTPTKKAKSQPEEVRTMDFYQALRQVVETGTYVTKLEWNNPEIYMAMNGGNLCIFKEDKIYHPLLLRDVDITGTDWVFPGDAVVMLDLQAHQKE